jgi:DNA-binding CsgD family transcriptional regulator
MLISRAAGDVWLLSVCPLSQDSVALFKESRCRAWVCITDLPASQPGLQSRLGGLFGLTLAEQRTAAALLNGLSPSEIAEHYRISLPTVRTQIQSILGKLGVRRQADLIRLIAAASTLPLRT